jgi:hypothetical protein
MRWKWTGLVTCAVVGLGGALLAGTAAGCGGSRTRVVEGHEITFGGRHDEAYMSIDGVPVRVVYDRVAEAYRAPGCDFGPAATLESLADQVGTTSPGTCERLEPAAE